MPPTSRAASKHQEIQENFTIQPGQWKRQPARQLASDWPANRAVGTGPLQKQRVPGPIIVQIMYVSSVVSFFFAAKAHGNQNKTENQQIA